MLSGMGQTSPSQGNVMLVIGAKAEQARE
jgi:hypothetical protein